MTSPRRALATLFAVLAACGGDDDGPPIDAPAPDAPAPDAPIDAPGPDAPIDGPDIDAPVAPPIVTITSHPADQRILGSRTVTIAGELVAEGTVDSVTVTVGAAAPIGATFTQDSFTASITLGDRDSLITVTATDTSEGSGSDAVTLTYPYLSVGDFEPATLVLGQPNFFTKTLRPVPDPGRFNMPEGQPAEHGGVLYIPDPRGNRVLGYRGFPSETGQGADFALGQPNFTTAMTAARADRLAYPTGVAVDQGALFVADWGNNRIAIWSTVPASNAAPADRVVGQSDLTTRLTGCSATRLNGPIAVAVAGGRLIVADSFNRRVLIWNTIPAVAEVPPDLVLGQGDFAHCAQNDDNQDGAADAAPTARTLGAPFGLWSDGQRLLVSDLSNRRVLIWNTFPTASFQPADAVLGQPNFTSSGVGSGPARLRGPGQLASNGNQLFVADGDGSRVMIWNTVPSAGVPADRVLGQGDFTHFAQNDDDQDGSIDSLPTARSLARPEGVGWVRDRLLVTDTNNHRYLMFGPPLCPIDSDVFEFPAGSGTCVADPCDLGTCAGNAVCDRSTGAAECVCHDGHIGPSCDVCVRYVDAAAVGTGDGFTWANAATTLQAGADAAFDAGMACDVWAKAGTYYQYRSPGDTATLSLRGPVTVRGGFAGNETSAAARSGGPTIVDGHEGPAEAFDVHHVLSSVTSTPGTPVIERLTIRGGNADSSASTRYGGGVLVSAGARLTITDCIIEGNRAGIGGGGLASLSASPTAVTVSATRFFSNFAAEGGGGAFMRGGTISDSELDRNGATGVGFAQGGGGMLLTGTGTATRNRFVGNSASGVGGALLVFGPSAAWTISDSELVGNRANGDGGAIYFDEFGSGSTLTRSVLAGNYAFGSGGAIFIFESATVLSSLAIVGNVAGTVSGIANSDSSASLVNSIVWDNVSGSGGGVQVNAHGTFTATYSDIAGGFPGTGNLDVEPQFVHVPLAWEAIINQSALDTVVLRSSAGFAVGDHIEIGDDGVARQITGINVNALTFTPVLVTSYLAATVENWGAETVNLVADFHLAPSSPLIDAGAPAGTDLGRYP